MATEWSQRGRNIGAGLVVGPQRLCIFRLCSALNLRRVPRREAWQCLSRLPRLGVGANARFREQNALLLTSRFLLKDL